MYLHIRLQKRQIKCFNIFLKKHKDGMQIGENQTEDIISICFISLVIILIFLIQVTGAL